MARRSTTAPPEDFEEHIVDVDVRDEMRSSYLEYAYSVIYSRALPDARDGLKPVQRRILYTMHDMGVRPDRGHVKSARVVGEVMGRLHPHGDGAIYDALVRMAQPWAMRLPLIDGHGNFGSPDDPPAAMRYTECRMAPAARPDDRRASTRTPSTSSPTTTAASSSRSCCRRRSPTCSSTARSGIAVGMATNMAPHNLVEVVQALRHLITHPTATLDDLMRFVPGPDLPTGGKIVGLDGIREAYETGRGSFRMRASARIENVTPRRKGIVVTELPYNVGPERVIERIKRAGPDQEAAGHRRRQGPDRPHQGSAAGHRDQERLPPRGDPRAALPPDADGGLVRRSTRSRSSTGSRAPWACGRCSRSTSTTASTSYAVGRSLPPHEGAGAPAPGRGPADRDPRHRRGHPADPRRATTPSRPSSRLIDVFDLSDDAGHLHPRHAAAPADEVLDDSSWRPSRRSSSARSRSSPRSSTTRRCSARLTGDELTEVAKQLRHAAPHGAAGVGRAAGDVRGAARGRRRPVPRAAVVDRAAGAHAAATSRSAQRRCPRQARRGHRGRRGHRTRHRRRGDLAPAGWSSSASSTCRRCRETANAPTLQGGAPITEFVALEPGERVVTLDVAAADDSLGLALGTRAGVVKRVQPEVLSQGQLGGDPARRRRRGRRRCSSSAATTTSWSS